SAASIHSQTAQRRRRHRRAVVAAAATSIGFLHAGGYTVWAPRENVPQLSFLTFAALDGATSRTVRTTAAAAGLIGQ
ncbi:unnamed protein product, partial [Polarella glacialis]